MTNYYIDIELKPDLEMRESPLMNLVYTKLHNALVFLQTNKIGVSFPGFNIKPGRTVRLHGTKAELEHLQGQKWLGSLNGYCATGKIKMIPEDTKFRTIFRIRTNISKSKLRRLKKRGSITLDEEKSYKAKMFATGLTNPYFDLKSGSTGKTHRRFIQFGPLLDNPVVGSFDSYGLSKEATIPWF